MLRLWLIAAVALALGACESKKASNTEQLVRQGDAPPVVYVDEVAEEEGTIAAEVEPNDDPGQASAVGLPGGIKGELTEAGDVDHFRVAIPKGAAVVVSATSENVDLKVEGLVGDKVTYSSDRGPKGTREGFPNLRIDGGGDLILRVTEFVPKKKKSPAKSEAKKAYVLRVKLYEPRDGEESEPNEEPGAGEELLLGQPGYGFIGWHGDRDRWRVSLDGFSEGHSLDLDIRGVPGSVLSASLFAPSGDVVASRKGERGSDLHVRSLEPGSDSAFYDLIISGSRSNPEEPYRVTSASTRLEEGDEREPNETPEQATVLFSEDGDHGETSGFLLVGDVDHYRLEAPSEPAVLFVNAQPPAADDLILEVLQGGQVVAEANASTAGGRERIVGLPVDAGRAIFVRVSGRPGPTPSRYRLEWKLSVGGAVP